MTSMNISPVATSIGSALNARHIRARPNSAGSRAAPRSPPAIASPCGIAVRSPYAPSPSALPSALLVPRSSAGPRARAAPASVVTLRTPRAPGITPSTASPTSSRPASPRLYFASLSARTTAPATSAAAMIAQPIGPEMNSATTPATRATCSHSVTKSSQDRNGVVVQSQAFSSHDLFLIPLPSSAASRSSTQRFAASPRSAAASSASRRAAALSWLAVAVRRTAARTWVRTPSSRPVVTASACACDTPTGPQGSTRSGGSAASASRRAPRNRSSASVPWRSATRDLAWASFRLSANRARASEQPRYARSSLESRSGSSAISAAYVGA